MNYKKIINSILLLAVLVIVSACNNEPKSPLLNEVVTTSNIVEVGDKVTTDELMTNDEINLFINGLNRMINTPECEFNGKSVGEIIELQEADARTKLQTSVGQLVNRLALNANHSFKLLNIFPYDTLESYNTVFKYEVTNKSDKNIKKIVGSLAFYNQANQLIKNYPLKSDFTLKAGEVIEAGGAKQFVLPFTHDPKSPRDMAIREQMSNLRPVWTPTSIEFEDGEVINIKAKEEAPKEEAAKAE